MQISSKDDPSTYLPKEFNKSEEFDFMSSVGMTKLKIIRKKGNEYWLMLRKPDSETPIWKKTLPRESIADDLFMLETRLEGKLS